VLHRITVKAPLVHVPAPALLTLDAAVFIKIAGIAVSSLLPILRETTRPFDNRINVSPNGVK
jgi:hypothetical protein